MGADEAQLIEIISIEHSTWRELSFFYFWDKIWAPLITYRSNLNFKIAKKDV